MLKIHQPIDWRAIDARVCKNTGSKPWEVDEFTIPEIECVIQEGRQGSINDDDEMALRGQIQSMSPKEKLQAMLRGEL